MISSSYFKSDVEQHFFQVHNMFTLFYCSKKKHYDGSETLKMIGNDCKLTECNIDTFLDEFVKERNDLWNSEKSLKLRQVLSLYKSFGDLAM